AVETAPRDAGWSSQVARRAHNPEVAGSNPAPATGKGPGDGALSFLLRRAILNEHRAVRGPLASERAVGPRARRRALERSRRPGRAAPAERSRARPRSAGPQLSPPRSLEASPRSRRRRLPGGGAAGARA